MEFNVQYDRYLKEIEENLKKVLFSFKGKIADSLFEAVKYSLLSGGKRIRPVLCLASAELLDVGKEKVIDFACAIEMIHTYSLVHDDLPAIDNDDFRRGKPSLHRAFGEYMAVFAGDCLLNMAFEHMIGYCMCAEDKQAAFSCMGEVAGAAGGKGMLSGQVYDMEKIHNTDMLIKTHEHKTGALIKASVTVPLFYNSKEEYVKSLALYSSGLGLAFQIKDDILDVVGEEKKMGKKVNKDKDIKYNYISAFGLNEAQRRLESVCEDAKIQLNIFEKKADFLKNIVDYVRDRDQ